MSFGLKSGSDGVSGSLQINGVDVVSFGQEGIRQGVKSIRQISTAATAGNLTVTLSPCTLDFRSPTVSDGTITTITNSSAISVTIPTPATLGTTSNVAARLSVIAINNLGTMELAIANSVGTVLDEVGPINTTAISTTANSASTVYSTSSRNNVPYRVVGTIETTQVAAGTWVSAPSKLVGIADYESNQKMVLTAAQATTSGTSIDFTGIPSWAKKITLNLLGVSTNGTANYLIQAGTSGGIVTTGYNSTGSAITNASAVVTQSSTAGLVLVSGSASVAASGAVRFELVASNSWVSEGIYKQGTSTICSTAGDIVLSSTLDRIRLTTDNGTDTFDAGSVSLLIEGY